MNKKILVSIIAGSTILVLIVVAGVNSLKGDFNFFRQFQSFSLTVVNQSDFDIVSVETGILQSDASGNVVEGDSKHLFSKVIKSGQQTVIKPQLTINNEGGIYMKYVDSSGKEFRTTVCSYTESASGYSIVTIMNDKIEVEEECI